MMKRRSSVLQFSLLALARCSGTKSRRMMKMKIMMMMTMMKEEYDVEDDDAVRSFAILAAGTGAVQRH